MSLCTAAWLCRRALKLWIFVMLETGSRSQNAGSCMEHSDAISPGNTEGEGGQHPKPKQMRVHIYIYTRHTRTHIYARLQSYCTSTELSQDILAVMHHPALWTMMMTSSDLPAASVLDGACIGRTPMESRRVTYGLSFRWFLRATYNALRLPNMKSLRRLLSY